MPRKRISRSELCPCNSGRRYKNCCAPHMPGVRDRRVITAMIVAILAVILVAGIALFRVIPTGDSDGPRSPNTESLKNDAPRTIDLKCKVLSEKC